MFTKQSYVSIAKVIANTNFACLEDEIKVLNNFIQLFILDNLKFNEQTFRLYYQSLKGDKQ